MVWSQLQLLFQVGAIIVDSRGEKVLGEGWNRMPQGCEDRFAWAKGLNDILKTKYPYGKLRYIILHV